MNEGSLLTPRQCAILDFLNVKPDTIEFRSQFSINGVTNGEFILKDTKFRVYTKENNQRAAVGYNIDTLQELGII